MLAPASFTGSRVILNTLPDAVAPIVKPLTMPTVAALQPLAPAPYPLAPYGTYPNTYEVGQCTHYAASRVRIPNTWGNANTWAVRALSDGYTVSNVPIIGVIAQTSRGTFGHVGVVEAVNGGQILMGEQNYDYNGSIRSSWQPASSYTYIYPK